MPERNQKSRRGGRPSGGRRGGGGRSSSGGSGPRSGGTKTSAEPLQPTLEPPDIESFDEWDLGDDVLGAIGAMGISKPTPIQALAIGPVLAGKDVIAKAETGTGKTLAFGAPMMAKIDPGRRSVLGLVLSPTRELAEQVHDVLEKLGEARGVKTCLIVGGEQMQPQVKALQDGAQVVVGTPGRVLDLLNQRFLSLPWTEFAILDEADKMLEIGFIDDVRKILEQCNEYAQTLLFSATFPPQLLDLARSHTSEPAEIATASGVATVDNIRQLVIRVDSEESRPRVLARMIEASGKDDVFLVFCERRTDVDRLLRRMERERFSVKALHGGYDQAARFRVMGAFRTGEVKCLLATDVASRGLDVEHVTHVVNLGVPRDVSDYTHRIGRTGRAGRSGTAITFVTPRDERRFSDLRRASGFDLEEIVSPRDVFRGVRRRDEAGEDDDRPRRRGGRGRDEERGRDEGRERPRGRDRDRDAGDREERPRRRGRRDERDDERPRREERGRDRDRPRRRERAEPEPRERKSDDSPEERPRKRAEKRREAQDQPASAPRSGGGGFGAGLDSAGEEPKEKRRGGRRPSGRREREGDRAHDRPVEGGGPDDPTPTKERSPSKRKGGFGAGL